MQRELTITLSEDIYTGLMELVGEQNASQFIEAALRPYILIGTKKQSIKIHSPRLVDRSQADLFKMELIEQTDNA